LKKITKKNIQTAILGIVCLMLLVNIFFYGYSLIPKNMKIYFIDVGQGDSCLIVTPNNKKILIDGGEGKPEVLLSYLLDRRIKTIDYIMISHFDSDHCNGLIEVINNLNVKNILIPKQVYFCDEYKNIANIINSKKINATFVKRGDKLNIDKDVKLNIFYPYEKLEYDDLNNNSIVAKLTYNSFSVLFTGDIEKAEENLLDKYKNNELQSDVIKIAHHGSKTSSSQEFLEKVKPKIALIGVGENNNFGHPSNIVLERLKTINCKICRTDKMGEIEIIVNKKGGILIKKFIEAAVKRDPYEE
jgi:DNA internalization-related competence protein ComEC/Rec2